MAQPHDAPSARELVAAVREFLEREVLPGAAGRPRFHCLVSINVLGMVERELDLAGEHEAAHDARLAALGYPDDQALAAAIRAGALDTRYTELKAALEAEVQDKLAVANPDYPNR